VFETLLGGGEEAEAEAEAAGTPPVAGARAPQ
jgi:hypothetical protein